MVSFDLEEVRSQIASCLPIHARWLIRETPLDFDFSRSQRSLQLLSPSDLNGYEVEPDWAYLYIFGEQHFADGGGASAYLGVLRDAGSVFGLDIERTRSPIFFFNSSVRQFIETFRLFENAMAQGEVGLIGLERLLREIDPPCAASSEWQEMGDYLCTDDK